MANNPRDLPGFEIEEGYTTGEIKVRRKSLTVADIQEEALRHIAQGEAFEREFYCADLLRSAAQRAQAEQMQNVKSTIFDDYTTGQQVREKLWPDTEMQALKDRVQELEGEVEMLRDEKAGLQDEVDYLEHALARATKDDIPF